MYRLYGDKGSGAAMVEAALAEIGEPYEFVRVDLSLNEQQAGDYRRLNSAKKIPALELEDGTLLTESAAILHYLGEQHAGAKLLPPPRTTARANTMRWLIYVVAEIYPLIEMRDYPGRFINGEKTQRLLQSRAIVRLRERWLIVEVAITGLPWLGAEGISVADLAIGCVSRWAIGREWRLQNCPKIEAINAAIVARPLAGPVWQRHFDL